MSALLVLLPPEPASGSGDYPFAVTPDGRTVARSGQAAAALLPAPAGPGSEVVAVVPASAVSWHRIEWPRGVAAGSARLRSVLEGLLEEQLLDDPETVHFALGPEARPGQGAWVAVCARDWLRAHLQALEAAGRSPQRVVPELAPDGSAALWVTDQDSQPWAVLRQPSGVHRLPLNAEALAWLPPLEDDTLFLAEPSVSAQAETLLQRPAVLQSPAQRWVQATHSRWDLAQFDLARSGRRRGWARLSAAVGVAWRAPTWRPARWAALALLLVHLVGLQLWAWQAQQTVHDQRAAAQNVVTRTFPQVKVVIDAPLQMERELALLRQATGAPSAGDLESLLAAWSQASGGAALQALAFDPRGLRVQPVPGALTAPETLRTALRARGLQVQTEGAWWVLRPGGRP